MHLLDERPAIPRLIFSGYGCFMNFLALKIDVDTLRGTLEGVLALAVVMGFIGGLFPAIRAARLPVAQALRET